MNVADSVVKRAGETVARVQNEYEKAEFVAQEARNNLSKVEADLRKLQDDKTQAAYRALSEVHPLSEKLRNHEDVAVSRKKEFGIFGTFEPTYIVVEPPTSLEITKTIKNVKPTFFSEKIRVDTLRWKDEKNCSDTMYIIEVAKGQVSGRGAVVWDKNEFYEIGRTSEKTFTKEWSDSEKKISYIYRIKSFFRGVESMYCDSEIVQ